MMFDAWGPVYAYPDERLPDVYISAYDSVFWLNHAPTRAQLLAKCDQQPANCKFQVDGASGLGRVPGTRMYQDRIVNCYINDATLALSWSATVGGSISMGVQVSVTASGGVPGALAIESSVSAEFGQSWDWSASRGKSVSVPVAQYDWAQLVVSPLMQQVKGKYVITSSSSLHGRNSWRSPTSRPAALTPMVRSISPSWAAH